MTVWQRRTGTFGISGPAFLIALTVGAQSGLAADPKPAPVVPQTPANETFGDWKKVCEVPPGSTAKVCFVFQKVNFAETDSMLLQAVAGFFRADLNDPILILTVPLGTFLPPGLELRVKGAAPLNSHFEVCMSVGCQASFKLDAARLSGLSHAKTAEVLVRDGAKKQVSIPLSLKGLPEGLDNLRTRSND